MTNSTSDERIYFPSCEDEKCRYPNGHYPDGHYHGDRFRTWRQSLTDSQRDELRQMANIYQKSLSWVAANVGVRP